MRDVGNGHHLAQIFESVSDVLDYVNTPTLKAWDTGDQSRSTRMPGWHGTASWDAAMGLALQGYRDPRPSVDAISESLVGHVSDCVEFTATPVYDVAGGAVDIGRFVEGEPECMTQFIEVPASGHGNVVTLLIGGSYSGRTSPDTVIQFGAAVCALVMVLAAANRSVEIWSESCSAAISGPELHSTVVRLKAASDPIDIDQLMFAIAHPSWFRRIVFAVRERMPAEMHEAFRVGTAYGSALDPMCSDLVSADLVISNGGLRASAYGVSWVLRTLATLGVEIER